MCKICRMLMFWIMYDGRETTYMRDLKWEHMVNRHMVVNEL